MKCAETGGRLDLTSNPTRQIKPRYSERYPCLSGEPEPESITL
jgi:hypothetical protein